MLYTKLNYKLEISPTYVFGFGSQISPLVSSLLYFTMFIHFCFIRKGGEELQYIETYSYIFTNDK